MRYLLIIDTAGNVVLGNPDTGVRIPIGEPLSAQEQTWVSAAVWSPGGEWTAWSVDSDGPDGLRQLRIHDEETDEATVLAESASAFYMSPSPCGRWLSHLSPGPLGLELAISDVRTGQLKIIERGQPMFWSWSSDSTRLAVHVEDRVLVAPVDGSPVQTLSEQAGAFVVPWWLPGGSVMFADGDQIVAVGPDGFRSTLVPGGATGRFSPDPDGRRIAHVEHDELGARLVIIDLVSNGRQVVTTEPIGGFFWSPDGSQLACLAAAGDGQLQWFVANGAETHRLPPFRPGRTWVSSVLPFFEQYAQSHRHWSADGTQLVVPAVGADGRTGALIQDVERPYTSEWLADAEMVWWV